MSVNEVRNFRLVAAVWGSAFVDLFLKIGLRSLLSDGNLLDLGRTRRVVFDIHTTAGDARRIESAPIFEKIRTAVDARFQVFSTNEVDLKESVSHATLWKKSADVARQEGEVLVVIIPDIIYAQGTLVRWAQRLEIGSHAIYTPGPQVVLETILPELEARFPEAEAISIDFDEIGALAARHLHPIAAAMLRESPRRVGHPEHDIRPISKRGFVMRAFASQPFCVDMVHFDKVTFLNPEDHLESLSFEPCSTLSVEPLFKSSRWFYRPWHVDDIHMAQLGAWWTSFGLPGNIRESEHVYDFCLQDDEVWREERQRALIGGRMFRAQLVAASNAYKMTQALMRLGAHRSAAIVMFLLFGSRRLRRSLSLLAGDAFLIPADAAFNEGANAALLEALRSGREDELIRLVKRHVGRFERSADGNRSADARQLALDAGGAEIISGPHKFASGQIYVIDRLLMPGAAPARSEASTPDMPQVEPAAGAAAVTAARQNAGWLDHLDHLRSRVAIRTGRMGAISRFARNRGVSLLRRFYSLNRGALHMLRHRAQNALRYTYLYLCVIPGMRGLLNLTQRAVRAVRRDGISVICLRRISAHPRLFRLFMLARHHAKRLDLAGRAFRYWRAHGVRAAVARAREWRADRRRRTLRPPHLSSPLTAPEAATLHDLRLARALCAHAEILQFYEHHALPDDMVSEPLSLVRRLLAGLFGGNPPHQSMEVLLRELVGSRPKWAEAWLELGYLMDDTGRIEDAAVCYGTAASAQNMLDFDGSYPPPAALAYRERARIRDQRGELSEAAADYAASLKVEPSQRRVNVEYARLLRRLGNVAGALEAVQQGGHYENIQWPVPSGPRDALTMTFKALGRIACGA